MPVANKDILAFFSPPGAEEKKILIRNEYLTDYQKNLLDAQRAYDGCLFDGDPNRRYEWGTRLDSRGNDVERDWWKPRFMPSLAKDLVKTVSSYLTGKDKFPTIHPIGKAEFEVKPGNGEAKKTPEEQEREQRRLFADWFKALKESLDFENQVAQCLDNMLVKGQAPLMLSFYGGRLWYLHPAREWCNWSYSENRPDQLALFRESYFFTRHGDVDPVSLDPIIYLWVREITGKTWTETETPIKKSEVGEKLGETVILKQYEHKLPFFPVIIYETPDQRGVLTENVIRNLRGYIESYNDMHCGAFKNAQPQWVLLKDPEADRSLAAKLPARPGEAQSAASASDRTPLEPGLMWELYGRQIQSFENNAQGYEMGLQVLESEKSDLRQSVDIIDIPPDSEMSGKALMLRFGPQYSSIDRLRVRVSSAIRETAIKTMWAGFLYQSELVLSEDAPRPRKMDGESLSADLDWGQLIPITSDVIAEEVANASDARDAGFLSTETAQERILPMFNVSDIEGEKERIRREKEEKELNDIALADAAFKKMTKVDKQTNTDQSEDLENV